MGMPAGAALETLQRYGMDRLLPFFPFHKIAFVRSKEFHGSFGMAGRTDAVRLIQGMAFLPEPLGI